MDRLLLRPDEAADLLGCSPSLVYQLARRGEIPSIRLGRAVRVPVGALQAWLAERTHLPAAEVPHIALRQARGIRTREAPVTTRVGPAASSSAERRAEG